ncbi:MAG: transporter [Gammaproteobacteria bacterium]|nr:transporter [Gammaproteobacteria bacterium]
MKKIILAAASICIASSAFAGGYRVSLQGQKALGMGHAGAAMSESAETVFFNPAGMTQLESDMEIIAGITLIDGQTIYQNEDTGDSSETDSPIGTPINIYLSKQHSDQLSYGVGVYTPYGNSVEWKKDWVGSHIVNNIELKTVYIQPTIAYQLSDQYSIGLGPILVSGLVEYNSNLTSTLVDSNGDRANATLSASNVTGTGFNFGFMAKPSDELSIGISYRSEITLEARDEEADFENVPATLQAIYPDTTFDADLVLPAELTIGLAYHLSENTVIAFDINRAYWSAYENLDIQFHNSVGLAEKPRNYNDATILRLGVQHKLDDTLTIRGGIYSDESPVSDGHVTPETARNDNIGLTAGATFTMSENLEIDVSFLYLMFTEFDGTYDAQSFGGTYNSAATSIGAGFNYKF